MRNECRRNAKMTITDGRVRRSSDHRPLITSLRWVTAQAAAHLRSQRERASAFTLLELLIVVGIIAVLLV
ncbi:MAG: hypothetical protein DME61_11730, partial [Verrucomicrobia bacterium]